MRLITFITEGIRIRQILDHIGVDPQAEFPEVVAPAVLGFVRRITRSTA